MDKVGHFSTFTRVQQALYLRPRAHEKKVGERLSFPSEGEAWEDWLAHTPAKYIIVGLAEDVGTRANEGRGGAHTTWEPFLRAFLNMQCNPYLPVDAVGLLGAWKAARVSTPDKPAESLSLLRKQVAHIDTHVSDLVERIASFEKIPVVVGGGHNNALPILRGVCEARASGDVHAINLDAHTDLRTREEGRHSGNGFSYALHEGYLKKYGVLGVHQYYTPACLCEALSKENRVKVWWYEEIFFAEKEPIVAYQKALEEARRWLEGAPTGMELDLDVIAQASSSAQTPYGLSGEQARLYVRYLTERIRPIYFHICEGVYEDADCQTHPLIGKQIAYLVADFLACHSRKKERDGKITHYTA